MSAPFVGRGPELDALLALLPRTPRDRAPAAALVTGEPGSGKTRLLAEALQRSRAARSIRVLGFEPIQAIPLAAVGGLLRQLAKVPGHGASLDDLVFSGEVVRDRDPLRIYEAAHRALSSFGPLLLAIDDLQWVDEQSLGLVHYLLRAAEPIGQPLVVVAVARPSPAAAAFRASIDAEMPASRHAVIELGPLPAEDGLSLARAIDPALDEAAAIELWRRARGSPFWLEALARGRGADDPSNLLGERLRALSSDAGALLAALAVGARPYQVDDLAAALGWEVDRVGYAARELISRGLTLEVAGSLQLAHDLMREAAIGALPAPARRRLHAQLGESLEAGAGNDLQMLGEALAHRHAAGLPTAALALRLVASPQRRLLGSENFRLLASISDALEAGTPDQVSLDARLGELGSVLGEHELAIARWRRVSEHSQDPSQRQHAEKEAARAAYRLARPAEAHTHLDRARAAAPATPDSTARLDALQAEIELWLDHETAAGSRTANRAHEAAEEMAARAGGVERLSADGRRAYLDALEAATDAGLQEERPDDVMRLSEASLLVARELDEESHLSALMRTGLALRALGEIRESEARFRRAWDVSQRLVLPTATVEAGHGLARALRDLGRLEEARAIAAETLQLEARLGHPPARWGNAPAILHGIELSLGDPAALRAMRADAETEANPHYRLAIHQNIATWQARVDGRRVASQVEAELDAARSAAALARCPRCAAELSVVSAELLARIGRVADARRELAAWEERAISDYPMRIVWRTRAQAAIAMAERDDGRAASLLSALAERLERGGFIDDLLWTRVDLGRALAGRDRQGSVEALTEAAALAERVGALSQARLVSQELRRLGVRAWRRGRAAGGKGLDALSEREREVARLVADGESNREIAEALRVSPKTVERHMTNVLAKLGLRNRTELAALVRSTAVRGSPDE